MSGALLRVEGVVAGYRPDAPILHGVSVEAAPPETRMCIICRSTIWPASFKHNDQFVAFRTCCIVRMPLILRLNYEELSTFSTCGKL